MQQCSRLLESESSLETQDVSLDVAIEATEHTSEVGTFVFGSLVIRRFDQGDISALVEAGLSLRGDEGDLEIRVLGKVTEKKSLDAYTERDVVASRQS